jgi:hypothetical protein
LFERAGRYSTYIFGYQKDSHSDQYFKSEILGQRGSAGSDLQESIYTSNLKAAKAFFNQRIEKLSKKKIESLFNKIINGLKFQLYEVDDELDVFLRFETLNNRGKPLSTLERLKNRLIYLTTLLPDNDGDKNILRDHTNTTWKTVYEYLGKNSKNPLNEERFLKNHSIMFFDYESKESSDYSYFLLNEYFIAANVLNNTKPYHIGFRKIKNYLDSISLSVKWWFYILYPDLSNFCDDIKDGLNKLQRAGHGSFKPLLMAVMSKYPDNGQMKELLKAAERFERVMNRLIMTKSTARVKYFYELANSFYYAKDGLTVDDVTRKIKLRKDKEMHSLFNMGRPNECLNEKAVQTQF